MYFGCSKQFEQRLPLFSTGNDKKHNMIPNFCLVGCLINKTDIIVLAASYIDLLIFT